MTNFRGTSSNSTSNSNSNGIDESSLQTRAPTGFLISFVFKLIKFRSNSDWDRNQLTDSANISLLVCLFDFFSLNKSSHNNNPSDRLQSRGGTRQGRATGDVSSVGGASKFSMTGQGFFRETFYKTQLQQNPAGNPSEIQLESVAGQTLDTFFGCNFRVIDLGIPATSAATALAGITAEQLNINLKPRGSKVQKENSLRTQQLQQQQQKEEIKIAQQRKDDAAKRISSEARRVTTEGEDDYYDEQFEIYEVNEDELDEEEDRSIQSRSTKNRQTTPSQKVPMIGYGDRLDTNEDEILSSDPIHQTSIQRRLRDKYTRKVRVKQGLLEGVNRSDIGLSRVPLGVSTSSVTSGVVVAAAGGQNGNSQLSSSNASMKISSSRMKGSSIVESALSSRISQNSIMQEQSVQQHQQFSSVFSNESPTKKTDAMLSDDLSQNSTQLTTNREKRSIYLASHRGNRAIESESSQQQLMLLTTTEVKTIDDENSKETLRTKPKIHSNSQYESSSSSQLSGDLSHAGTSSGVGQASIGGRSKIVSVHRRKVSRDSQNLIRPQLQSAVGSGSAIASLVSDESNRAISQLGRESFYKYNPLGAQQQNQQNQDKMSNSLILQNPPPHPPSLRQIDTSPMKQRDFYARKSKYGQFIDLANAQGGNSGSTAGSAANVTQNTLAQRKESQENNQQQSHLTHSSIQNPKYSSSRYQQGSNKKNSGFTNGVFMQTFSTPFKQLDIQFSDNPNSLKDNSQQQMQFSQQQQQLQQQQQQQMQYQSQQQQQQQVSSNGQSRITRNSSSNNRITLTEFLKQSQTAASSISNNPEEEFQQQSQQLSVSVGGPQNQLVESKRDTLGLEFDSKIIGIAGSAHQTHIPLEEIAADNLLRRTKKGNNKVFLLNQKTNENIQREDANLLSKYAARFNLNQQEYNSLVKGSGGGDHLGGNSRIKQSERAIQKKRLESSMNGVQGTEPLIPQRQRLASSLHTQKETSFKSQQSNNNNNNSLIDKPNFNHQSQSTHSKTIKSHASQYKDYNE